MNSPQQFDAPRANTDEPEAFDDMAAERSLVEDVRSLVEDGKLLAEAELEFNKKRLSYAADKAPGIAAHFVIAGVLVFFATMALVVGLVLALGQIITYWGSTVVVTAGLALLALLMLRQGKRKLAHLKEVVMVNDEEAA